MPNSETPRFTYLSHTLIAIGVLLLSIFIFNALAELISLKLFGFKPSDIGLDLNEEFAWSEVQSLRISQLALALAFISSVFVCTRVFRQQFIEFTSLGKAVVPLAAGMSLLIYVVYIPFNNWLIFTNDALPLPDTWTHSLREMEQRSNIIYQALLSNNSGPQVLINILIMACIPAISEELLFRSVFLRIFKSWTGNLHAAVALTSLLFAALHFQPYKVAPMFMLSVLFCYFFYLSGSIWIPILLHALNNALFVISASLAPDTGLSKWMQDDIAFPVWVTWLSPVATLGIFLLFWKFSRNKIELAFE